MMKGTNNKTQGMGMQVDNKEELGELGMEKFEDTTTSFP